MRWSNSALFTLQQCGERFRRRYIEKDWRPSGIRAKRGTAVHKIAAVAHMRQFTAREEGKPKAERLVALPTIEEAKDVASDAFDSAVQEGVAWTADEKAAGIEKVRGAEKDAAIAMTGLYIGGVAPKVDPLAVERRVIIRPPDTDVEIVGVVDLVEEEEERLEGERVMRRTIEVVDDLKTGDRSPQEDAAVRSQQLSIYALIRTAETGRPPDKVRLRTLVRTRTGKVSVVEQTTHKTEQDLEAVASRLNTAIETVKRGSFVPANPDSWWCSEKYCEYWSDCVFALGKGR